MKDNVGAISLDWPRLPFPRAADLLANSAKLGRSLMALLDPEKDVPGVTAGDLRNELRHIAVSAAVGGTSIQDLSLTAGWGYGTSVVMPGQGKLSERAYRSEERTEMAEGACILDMEPDALLRVLGETTCDVWLNDEAYWANVPINVWRFKLGGYQVIKKWLSYREKDVLGRPLRFEEVLYVSEMARRVAAILLMGPELDANYRAVVADAIDWQELKGSPQPDVLVEART